MRHLFLTSLVLIIIASCREDEMVKPYKTGMEGKPIPRFTIQLLDSVSYLHSQDIANNKKFIIFYFSPTCPYCRAQMREMVNNIERFKDQNVFILTNANLSSIERFADYFDLKNCQNVVIGRDTGNVIPKHYGLAGVPFTAYFDENKYLKKAYFGRISGSSLFPN